MTSKYEFPGNKKLKCKTKNAYGQCFPLVTKPKDKRIFDIGLFNP